MPVVASQQELKWEIGDVHRVVCWDSGIIFSMRRMFVAAGSMPVTRT